MDDEENVQESLKIILSYQGYDVDIASTGAQGLEFLKTETCDLLILDLKMPDQDGFEILKTVRQQYPSLKVILITGFGTLDIARKALALGAIHYFDKPIDLDRFIRKIKTALPI
jgi:two-component system nitrogen regulation response regulator NtrX